MFGFKLQQAHLTPERRFYHFYSHNHRWNQPHHFTFALCSTMSDIRKFTLLLICQTWNASITINFLPWKNESTNSNIKNGFYNLAWINHIQSLNKWNICCIPASKHIVHPQFVQSESENDHHLIKYTKVIRNLYLQLWINKISTIQVRHTSCHQRL